MRLRIEQGTVSLGGKIILDHIDFEIRGKDKIALVGPNGAGKSTLLKLIHGDLSLDRDDKRQNPGIWTARNTTVGILTQNPIMDKDQTVEALMDRICPVADPYSRERYEFETEYHRMFTRLGFNMEETSKRIEDFSGGQQTKIALIGLLLSKPDILLLDEPTNHLDIQMTKWLEEYLKTYEKAVVMVSHDRFFLDQVSNITYELDKGKTTRYPGNYSNYRKEREEKIAILKKKYREQEEEIQRLNELIERFKHKPRKASMARSKKKVLERMEKIENPEYHESYLYPGDIVPLKQTGKWVYDCQKLLIGYDRPIHEINLRIRRGQKIGIIGANGIGKSTFLKTIAEILPPLSGKIIKGNYLDCAYYDQLTSEIEGGFRLLEDFQKSFPSYSLGDCRKILARFLFRKEELAKTISDLSGGEKSRYSFAKLLETKPNVLLLDEPTNHLDIPSREILESAFMKYQGTLLFITHDRYFLKQVASSLLIFEKDRVIYYPYDYAHYLEAQEREVYRKLQGIRTMEEENAIFAKSFEEVPERKRMQSARLNTEQSYTDWQLGLIHQELERCQLQREALWTQLPTMNLENYKRYHEEYGIPADSCQTILDHLQELDQRYTEICLSWYDKWMEYEEAFEDYHDA